MSTDVHPSSPAATCRFCSEPLQTVFADLGMSPLANSFVRPERLNSMEPYFPLRAFVCHNCFLVQLEEFETPEAIFGDYAYFSSYSTSWVQHAKDYVGAMVARWALDQSSHVVELASNDGYLLQWFQQRDIPVLGVEPAENVAELARSKGVPTVTEFFGIEVARGLAADSRADLLVGNNVLAHVPDLNDFVGGMKVLLAEQGVVTMEFPHLLRLVVSNQWDTIYHEHFSYFSFTTVQRVFAAHDLRVFDADELPTHGGSLRIYACHEGDVTKANQPAIRELEERELAAGLHDLGFYAAYGRRVEEDKREALSFLIEAKRKGHRIAGYGAPAKGNTFLNFCGVGREFVDFTVDANPHKQGSYLPGSRIPIRSPQALIEERPDIVLILPWNLADEITQQQACVRDWGGRFAARTPRLEFLT